MKVFNTMSRKKEELVPIEKGKINMYVCGPTVYSYIHIGNARPLIVFDTMRRYLEYLGYEVRHIMNFTDIDDKVIRRANEEGVKYSEIAERYIKEFYKDADSLNVKRSTENPRATDHIDDILNLVQKLIDGGHAYAAENGDVYFSVRSFPGYGKLSGQSIDSLESGARIDPTEEKKDPLDFALWKGAKPGEPSWTSPWGEGRPGWHIECSAMSMQLLGDTFDIHAGGTDLIFPHHENEIAQSEAATGKPFAQYWMHNGHINVDNQKMSKSKGNFFNVRDITASYAPEVVRLFMLSTQYRSPMNFSKDALDQSAAAMTRLETAKERLYEAQVGERTPDEDEFVKSLDTIEQRFRAAMDDDLNTADAIGVLFDLVRMSNTFVAEPHSKETIEKLRGLFNTITDILGILKQEKKDEFPAEAIQKLNERNEARAAKNWALADKLRDELKEMGYVVEDSKTGAKLKKID